jgi:hypothetical protein
MDLIFVAKLLLGTTAAVVALMLLVLKEDKD